MDSAPWPQEIVVKPMDEFIVANTTYHHQKPPSSSDSSVPERKVRTQKNQQALSCPRCHSTNTKFCYYNNYSLSQPRYICKTCRRYWTKGGSLRNIPVGGGSRKNKRSTNNYSSSSTNSPAVIGTSSCKKILTAGGLLLPPPPAPTTQRNPNGKIHENSPQDLNLGFSTSYCTVDDHHHFKSLTEMIQVPNFESNKNILKNSSALELLTGFTGSRDLENCGYMPMIMTRTTGSGAEADHLQHNNLNTVYSTGFPLSAEFMKELPSDLNFSLDGLGSNYGSFQGVQENTDGKLLFPFEDLKTHKVSSNNANDADEQENRTQNGNDDSNGFWNGVIERGSW